MAFEDYEVGEDTAIPVEFYKFARGTSVWLYTTEPTDTEFNGETYLSVPVRRSTVREEQTRPESVVTVYLPVGAAFISAFVAQSPSDNIAVTIWANHIGAEDGDAVTIFKGRVTNVKHKEFEGEVTCEPIITAMARPVLRRFYQRSCPYTLYDSACGVDKDSFKVTTTLDGGSYYTVSAAAFDAQVDGYFAGGYLEWEVSSGIFERRMIIEHVGSTLTLAYYLEGIEGGETVTAYAGCNHNLSHCDGKFNNKLNYGGIPHMTTKNIMSGTKIF